MVLPKKADAAAGGPPRRHCHSCRRSLSTTPGAVQAPCPSHACFHRACLRRMRACPAVAHLKHARCGLLRRPRSWRGSVRLRFPAHMLLCVRTQRMHTPAPLRLSSRLGRGGEDHVGSGHLADLFKALRAMQDLYVVGCNAVAALQGCSHCDQGWKLRGPRMTAPHCRPERDRATRNATVSGGRRGD